MTELDDFIDMILNDNNIQPYAIFSDNNYKDKEDLVCTFFSFLVSRCVIRYAPRYTNYGVYVFSNPGRIIMEDKTKRIVFIEEFMRFYET